MSLPHEKARALIKTRALLIGIASSNGKIKKRQLRQDIYCALRHFPFTGEIADWLKTDYDGLHKQYSDYVNFYTEHYNRKNKKKKKKKLIELGREVDLA